jgi:uncharacterized lipoprotein YmbA
MRSILALAAVLLLAACGSGQSKSAASGLPTQNQQSSPSTSAPAADTVDSNVNGADSDLAAIDDALSGLDSAANANPEDGQ